jgi:aerobic carbon-monoxide dehydrogenase medium subunit
LTRADLSFRAPLTLSDALAELASEPDAIAMGGGTSVGLLLKNYLIEPRTIVWLARIPGLRRLEAGPGGDVSIGATVTLREIAGSGVIRRLFPALAYAAGRVGNPRVRAVATLGGALAHSDPRQDVPPILNALDARVGIAGPAGEREVPVAGFHTGFMETVLGQDELVTHVVVPAVPGRRAAYARFTPGSADDYPTVSAAASIVRGADGRVSSAILALGGVGPAPLLVPQAAGLTGIVPGAGEIQAVAEAAEAAADPSDDQRGSARYKKAMAREWAARVLRACLEPDSPPVPGIVAG